MSIPTHVIDVEIYDAKGQPQTKTVTFKSFRFLPSGVVRLTRHSVQDQMYTALEWALDKQDLMIVDLMPSEKLNDLMTRMQEISNVSLGESPGSSKTSSTSQTTARRSKRTSSTGEND